MLTEYRRPIQLQLTTPEFPNSTDVETIGLLSQRDRQEFHLRFMQRENFSDSSASLVWFDFSPYRVTLTMQGPGGFSYRHFWERGVYGMSRYWLSSDPPEANSQILLRNYTRSLTLVQNPLPSWLQIDYELWSGNLRFGRYRLSLEIHH